MPRLLLRPAGFVLALMCFALPFIAVSCDSPVGNIRADYSGGDFVFGGRPDLVRTAPDGTTVTREDYGGKDEDEDEGDGAGDGRARPGPQPSAVLAFLAVIGSLVASVVPRVRAHTLGNLGASVGVVLLLIANQIVLYGEAVAELQESSGEIFAPQAAEMVQSRYGFWLALVILLVVVGFNVVELIRERGGLAAVGLAGLAGAAGPVAGGADPGAPPTAAWGDTAPLPRWSGEQPPPDPPGPPPN